MDFDSILSVYKSKTCIISVEKFPDGKYGNIRIAAGNKAHCDDMMNVMHHPFIPDSPYEEYFPENKNFEDFCCRCAFTGQPLHSYVSLPQMGLWLNMFLLPLESDKENIGYCIYSYDVTPKADTEQRAALSADTSNAVLQTCIKLHGEGNTRQTFREVIEDIRNICDSNYCCILLVYEEERRCTTLCEALRNGVPVDSIDNYNNDAFYDIVETWKDTIGDSTCIIIKDEADMEWLRSINPLWHKSLCDSGAKSIVMFPLKHNGKLLGYMFASDFNVDNTVKIKETLELSTFFIASEIDNCQLLERFEILSSVDMLTGVKNRNAMNNVVDEIKAGKKLLNAPYAVLFTDLNGLKKVNDVEGHSAGDQLLKKVAAMLQRVFFNTEIYRAGGDEFMILVEQADKDEIDSRLERLREQSEKEDGHFAVGVCYVDGDMDILNAMRIADERMYDDKKEYYRRYPERKYR
jgi:diguanylate cyclase (GGDEF)-like protein